MKNERHFTIGEQFRPADSFVRWYVIDVLIIIAFAIVFIFLPVGLFGGLDSVTLASLAVFALVIIAVFFGWVRLFYESMQYQMREDEISWKRGVWFRRTGIVPYNRITNLDLVQGPVMRYLGISTLAIQTAGYSGQAVPEIRIEAIEHADELREMIRERVRRSCRSDDGTGGREAGAPTGSTDERILAELVSIREILERQEKNIQVR